VSVRDRTLLLNATYEPLQVIPWQRAVTMLFLEKVEVLRTYQAMVRSVTLAIELPAVVRLREFVRLRRVRLGFSRRSVLVRDNYRCQYCARRCSPSEITCDHVVPRAQGGPTTWDNVVACCVRCNRVKGGRTPEQANMRLLRKPRQPEDLPLVFRLPSGERVAPEPWRDFLVWGKGRHAHG